MTQSFLKKPYSNPFFFQNNLPGFGMFSFFFAFLAMLVSKEIFDSLFTASFFGFIALLIEMSPFLPEKSKKIFPIIFFTIVFSLHQKYFGLKNGSENLQIISHFNFGKKCISILNQTDGLSTEFLGINGVFRSFLGQYTVQSKSVKSTQKYQTHKIQFRINPQVRRHLNLLNTLHSLRTN